MYQRHPVFVWFQSPGGCIQGNLVPVDANQAAGGKLCGNPAGMSCTAQGAIHIDAIRFDIQSVNAFFQQDGYMVKFCHIYVLWA